jgi:hypothetical protein
MKASLGRFVSRSMHSILSRILIRKPRTIELSGLGLEPEGRAGSTILPSLRPIAFCVDCNVA